MRRICFVTGTRAEFGLMRRTLRAIRESDRLQLQLVVTGMHLSAEHGGTADAITADGWTIDRRVDWPADAPLARATGVAMAGLADAFGALDPAIVLVVGDRVEPFAAASAAHLQARLVAHIHGGDRAAGQADDSLRHAITKLAHIHFPATEQSAARIERLGEQSWRIHRVGAPGIEGIADEAADPAALRRAGFDLAPRSFALLVLHPATPDEDREYASARHLLEALLDTGLPRVVVVYPNNDPGYRGIARCWREHESDPRIILRRDLPREVYLGLLRDAAFLAGNSSSGIIEAASFATPVLDIGPRQLGRERSENVVHVPDEPEAIAPAVAALWNDAAPRRATSPNVYAAHDTARRIAGVLASVELTPDLRRKVIGH